MRKLILFLIISSKITFGQNHDSLYDLNRIIEIDQKSTKGTTYDVTGEFQKQDHPNIYRLAAILYTPYFINEDIVKIDMKYEGDRETIFESFYFDANQNIYLIKYHSSFFDPPKWDSKSKIILETKLTYFKEKNSWKSIGVISKIPDRLVKLLPKLKQQVGKVPNSVL